MMDDENRPIDLSPVDPTADPARFDVLVQSVMAAVQPGLIERRAAPSVLIEVGRWRKPLLAAAAVAALITWVTWPRSSEQVSPDAIATAIGVSTTMAGWMWSSDYPTAAQVFYTEETNQ